MDSVNVLTLTEYGSDELHSFRFLRVWSEDELKA